MALARILFLLVVSFGAAAHAFPRIQHWTTDNGARVYFVETHQIPMVQFTVGFDAGSARDPSSLQGLSSMVRGMLEEGAADMDGDAIATALESIGAQYFGGSGRDSAVVELRSLSDERILDLATEVFGKLIRVPSFPGEAFERVRERVLIGLKRREQSPGSVASRVFYRNLYQNHPYAHPPEGDEETVRNISRQDLVEFHREHYVGSNAVVVIVGDLSRDQARTRAGEIIGGLPRGARPDPVPEVPALGESSTLAIEFPSSQTHLMMGQPGITRDDPDYFPLVVGNHALGGNGLISRLATIIREERGLAYSVYSSFTAMRESGPFVINLQTRNDQAGLAAQLAMDTVRGFIATGPTPEELEASKNNIIGGFPLRVSSNSKIAGNVLWIAFYGLPLDYLETFTDRIEEVSLEQVTDAFRRRILPDSFVHIRVGGE